MNGTISDFLPFLQENAGVLYNVMIPVAYVLVVGGFMTAIHRAESNPAAYVKAVLSVGMIAAAIALYPDWVNLLQDAADSISEELDASPSEVHRHYAEIVAGTSMDEDKKTGLWDVLFSNGGIGHAVLMAAIFLTSKIAFAIQFLFFTLQQVLVQFQIGLAPIFLAFFLIGPLRSVAVKFQMNLIALLLWRLGWDIASLMSKAIVTLAATNELYQKADDFYIGGGHTLFYIIVLTLWIILSTIGAPLVIRKLLTSGANAGAILLGNIGQGISQGAIHGTSAGVTMGMNGGSTAATATAATIGGAGSAVSGTLGSTGVLMSSAIGIGAAVGISNTGGNSSTNHSAKAAELAKNARS